MFTHTNTARNKVPYSHTTFSTVVVADVIMDMLGDRTMRLIISKYYEDCGEEEIVKRAVARVSRGGEGVEQVDTPQAAHSDTKWTKIG